MQFGCRSTRDALIVATAFLAIALSMLASARFLPIPVTLLAELLTGLGLLALGFVPLILGAALVRAVQRSAE